MRHLYLYFVFCICICILYLYLQSRHSTWCIIFWMFSCSLGHHRWNCNIIIACILTWYSSTVMGSVTRNSLIFISGLCNLLSCVKIFEIFLQCANTFGGIWLSETFEHCVYCSQVKPWSYIESEAVAIWQFGFLLGLTLNLTQAYWRLQAQTELVFWLTFLLQIFLTSFWSLLVTFGHVLSKGQVQLWASESHVFTAAVEASVYQQQNGCITWHWDQYFALFTL